VDESNQTDLEGDFTILLVEDSEDDAFFFGRALEKIGGQLRRFTHLEDGSDAVEFLEEFGKAPSGPVLMFLDLKMPVMNGFDVLAWIRERVLAFPLQVMVLSGSDDPRDRARALELGAEDYLVKPIMTGALADKIQSALTRARQKRGALSSKVLERT
jgi:CheY-like chemotaxis protein